MDFNDLGFDFNFEDIETIAQDVLLTQTPKTTLQLQSHDQDDGGTTTDQQSDYDFTTDIDNDNFTDLNLEHIDGIVANSRFQRLDSENNIYIGKKRYDEESNHDDDDDDDDNDDDDDTDEGGDGDDMADFSSFTRYQRYPTSSSRLQPLHPPTTTTTHINRLPPRLQQEPINHGRSEDLASGFESITSNHRMGVGGEPRGGRSEIFHQHPSTRLDRILNPVSDKNSNNAYTRDRKRTLQPLPQTFHADDLSYDDYLRSNSSCRIQRIDDDSYYNTRLATNQLVSLHSTPTTTPTATPTATPTTTPQKPITPGHIITPLTTPQTFSDLSGMGGYSNQSTPSMARFNANNTRRKNQYSSRLEFFPHPFDTPSTASHTPSTSQSQFAYNQTALPSGFHQYNNTNGSMTSFPLLDDALGTFKPYYEQFLQYTIWALNFNVLHPRLLQPLYQSCLRFKAVPIPVGLEVYMDWSGYGLLQNLPVVNGELQVPLIPGLEEPSLQLLSILTNALAQRGNSHSLILGSPDDLPLLCVGSVLGHILFSQNSNKLNAVVIQLSGNVTTNDTLSIQSLCFQLCEQLGISCSLDTTTANFHDYAQFVTILLRQISTLDITDINTYDAKYNLYEHPHDSSGNDPGSTGKVEGLGGAGEISSESTSSPSPDTLSAIPIIIVLDGFDNFAKSGVSIDDNTSKGVSRQSFLYFLGDLAQTNQAWIHIIGIATSPVAYDYLEKRVKSRFPMQNIFLHNSLYHVPQAAKDKGVRGKMGNSTPRDGGGEGGSDDDFDLGSNTPAIDIFADSGSVLDRLRSVIYSFLALPCESINNINTPAQLDNDDGSGTTSPSPSAVMTSSKPTQALSVTSKRSKGHDDDQQPQQQQQQQQQTLGVVMKSKKMGDQEEIKPTLWDGQVPLFSLPITPRTWSPIDLTRNFTLPHWTQVFYYNTTLWATLQNEFVVENVLNPMVYSGFSLQKLLSMVSSIITNMVTYPTLLSPNIPPVLQHYQQYCEQVDEKRKMRYLKYHQVLVEKKLTKKKAVGVEDLGTPTTTITTATQKSSQTLTSPPKVHLKNKSAAGQVKSQSPNRQSPNRVSIGGSQQSHPTIPAILSQPTYGSQSDQNHLDSSAFIDNSVVRKSGYSARLQNMRLAGNKKALEETDSSEPFQQKGTSSNKIKKEIKPKISTSMWSNKIRRYLKGFKPTRVKAHFKYLSAWRGTSGIATLMICPWDLIAGFLHVMKQISDYETTLCELHNQLFSRPYTFNTKTITNQALLYELINQNDLTTAGGYKSNGLLMTPTKIKKNTNDSNSSTPSSNPPLKSEYVIDLGFIARLLRYFQSDLTNESLLNHTKVQHENNPLSFNAYLTQVSSDRTKYQQYYLPHAIPRGKLVFRDDEEKAMMKLKARLYFPRKLHFFQPGPSSPYPSPYFQMVSFCIEPDSERVRLAHQQYQTYKKAQIKQRQNIDNNNNNQTPSKRNRREQNKVPSLDDLSSIFRMYLQTWSSNSIIYSTTSDYNVMHPIVLSEEGYDTYGPYNGVNIMGYRVKKNNATNNNNNSSSSFNTSKLTRLSPHSTPRSQMSSNSQSSTGCSTPTSSQSQQHSRHGTPMKIRATPLKSTPSAKSSMYNDNSNPFNAGATSTEISEQLSVLHAPHSSFQLPTTSTSLSYFQTDALLNQHLSTLSCHSLGLLAAALRLELRGESAYSFNKLFEEHISFLHSWSLNQANINPVELYVNQESCLELYEQLIIDQLFVYCTKLQITSSHTRQLNLDLFVSDEGEFGPGQQRLAVINKGSQPAQIITVHPMQHQLHQFIKNNNASANLFADNQHTSVMNSNFNNNDNNQSKLLHKVKIQCVISRNQFFDFLKEFKIHLNKVRYTNPLDYESVPLWVDSLLDTDIKTTTTV